MSYLEPHDLLNVGATSRSMNAVSRAPQLWRHVRIEERDITYIVGMFRWLTHVGAASGIRKISLIECHGDVSEKSLWVDQLHTAAFELLAQVTHIRSLSLRSLSWINAAVLNAAARMRSPLACLRLESTVGEFDELPGTEIASAFPDLETVHSDTYNMTKGALSAILALPKLANLGCLSQESARTIVGVMNDAKPHLRSLTLCCSIGKADVTRLAWILRETLTQLSVCADGNGCRLLDTRDVHDILQHCGKIASLDYVIHPDVVDCLGEGHCSRLMYDMRDDLDARGWRAKVTEDWEHEYCIPFQLNAHRPVVSPV